MLEKILINPITEFLLRSESDRIVASPRDDGSELHARQQKLFIDPSLRWRAAWAAQRSNLWCLSG